MLTEWVYIRLKLLFISDWFLTHLSVHSCFTRLLFSHSNIMRYSLDTTSRPHGGYETSMTAVWRSGCFLLGPSHSSGPTAVCLVFSPCTSISDSPASRLPSSSPARGKVKKKKKDSVILMHTRHKVSSTEPHLIELIAALWTLLWVLMTMDIIPDKTLKSHEPLSQHATVCFCVYI